MKSGAVSCSAVLAAVMLTHAAAQLTTEQSWSQEYDEIVRQLGKVGSSGVARTDRIAVEALDPQALVQPTDGDPLSVVLRRTNALIQYFKTHKSLPASETDGLEARWDKLAAAAKATTPVAAREQLFLEVCALRRGLALTNPLLDFDDIVCMLEQPGDRRIIEQARAICAGHSNGGGPLVIRDFKSQAANISSLAGIKVVAGPWQGKELIG